MPGRVAPGSSLGRVAAMRPSRRASSVRSCPRAGRWSWPASTVPRPSGPRRSRSRSWPRQLGYDSIWVYDHVHNVPRPAHEAVFECWTTMAAISQLTSRIRLGQMVGCNSLPAAVAAGQDHLDRRRDLRRPARLGHRRRLVRERVPGLRLRVPGRQGPHRHAAGDASRSCARCGPSPRRPTTGSYYAAPPGQLRPEAAPVSRTRRSGSAAAASSSRCGSWPGYADCSNFGGKPEEWARKCEVLKAHCAAVGRDYDEIRKTWSPEVFVRETEAEVEAAGSAACGASRSSAGGPATWSAPPSRWPRRSRPTSTSAAPGSSRGAPTTRTPTSARASARRGHARSLPERSAELGGGRLTT